MKAGNMAEGIRVRARVAGAAMIACVAVAALPAVASASPFDPSGVIEILKPTGVHLNANQSSNWFGYNQGTLEQGRKLFNSITADWTVPTASQHTSGQAENNATWIGIGGGCVDAGCTVTDPSLIQTGTEQDVASGGQARYSAWWELIPAPAITISNLTIHPGDRIHADISEVVPDSDVWTITLSDTTTGQTFTQTVPYTSTHATAEWISETPLTIGTGGTGEAALPNLTEIGRAHV